eukprot:Gb_37235 [translate_table: standard]
MSSVPSQPQMTTIATFAESMAWDKGVLASFRIPTTSQPNTSKEIICRPSWADSILDGLINSRWEERLKIFEEGLNKSECELSNHEAWKPSFIANIIQVLVCDLVAKIKDLA